MKKIIVSILVVLMACSMAFAATEPKVVYDSVNFAYQPTLSRYDSMGQSGLASMSRLDSFYTNPAVIGKGGFGLSIPRMSFTFYNLQKLVSDPKAVEAFNEVISGNNDKMTSLATRVLENLGSGHNLVAKLDLGLALKAGILGFGTDFQMKIHSLNPGSSLLSTLVIPEINAAQTVALGLRLIDTDALSLSAGVSGHLVYKAYFKGIDGGKLVDLMSKDEVGESLKWETPVMGGWAVPIDLGVTLGIIDDQLLFSATANNINGVYHMKSYSGIGYLINSFSKGAVPGQPEGEERESEEFTVNTPWSLNFGVAFAPQVDILNPVVTLDLIDMFELCKSFGSEYFRASDLLLHMNAGVEFGLFDILTVKGGVNRGYLSVGTSLWLPFMEVSASYGWQEFGEEIGDKPVDSLTISFNLGHDKKR